MKLSLLTFNSLPFTYEVNVPGEVFEFFFFFLDHKGWRGEKATVNEIKPWKWLNRRVELPFYESKIRPLDIFILHS